MNRINRILSHYTPDILPNNVSNNVPVVTYTISDNIAVIVINSPPVNSLSPAVSEQLDKIVKELKDNGNVKGCVLTGKNAFFMAGADISATLQSMQKSNDGELIKKNISNGNNMCYEIETGRLPYVCALNGSALGGGLELAMACASRVALPKLQVGLPEIKLGIFPGMGGTQRLTRLIGVEAAVPYILSGASMNPQMAVKLGLIDSIVKDQKDLIETAKKLALAIADGKYGRRQALTFENKMRDNSLMNHFISNAMKQARKKFGPLPHPQLVLQAIAYGINNGGVKGVEKEAELFSKCILLPSAKAGVHYFLSEKLCPKIPGVTGKHTDRKIKRVAILGAGTMGAGIATICLQKGLFVVLKEIKQEFLDAGVNRIKSTMERFAKKKKLTPEALGKIMSNLQGQITFDGFDNVDLVIEAAVENIKIKQDIFAHLEKICSPTCILATNTSTINIDLIGANTKASNRIIGLHFFSPAHVMPLLEIVRTESTAPSVIADCVLWAQVIGKTPVVVGNCVGFVANRVFFPYGQSAGFLVDHGISPYRIDAALMKFGMPMGMFRMADMSGVDIIATVGNMYKTAYADRVYISPLPPMLVDAKRLGQKSGAGFYKHESGKPVPDPSLDSFLEKVRKQIGNKNLPKLTDDELVEIIMFPVINECCRVVSEKIVVRESDIDIISILGYGFPMFRGGLMHWADGVGFKHIYNQLQKYADNFSKLWPDAKGFYTPCAYLKEKAGL